MILSTVSIIVNVAFLVIALVTVVMMMRAGAKHEYNYGRDDVRERLSRFILRLIMLLVALCIVAAIFNLVLVPYFEW